MSSNRRSRLVWVAVAAALPPTFGLIWCVASLRADTRYAAPDYVALDSARPAPMFYGPTFCGPTCPIVPATADASSANVPGGAAGPAWLVDTSGFPPRWQCGQWPAALGWLHIVSDLLIWLAYIAIPCLLVFFVRRRADVPFKPVFWLFGAFIVACGTTHLIEAVIFWWPVYRLAGVVKLVTACVSLATVAALIPVLPWALAHRSPAEADEEVERRTMTLRDSLHQSLQIIEAAPSGMMMVDRNGTIAMVNARIETMFGYARDELIGKEVEQLIPERFRDEHPLMRRTFAEKPVAREMGAGRDLFGLRKDGQEFAVEIGLNPVDLGGEAYVLAAVVDVTLRRRFERRLEAAVESAPLAIVMIDDNGRIVLANRETERLFGFQRSELAGQPVELLVPERYRAEHPASRAAFFAAPETRRMGEGRDLFARRKDGTEFPVEIGLNPIEMEDESYVLSAIVDISERMQSKEKIEQYMAELVRSNEELEQFAYIASHDLQEPLRKVAACCQVLADDYCAQLDDKAQEWIGYAVDGAQRMRQLVSDLLAYSRVGTQGKELVPTDAAAACRTAIDNLSEAISESAADVRMNDLPRVMADETQLIQLFQNLIGNALKYRAAVPPIVEIGGELCGRYVRFFVRDNGIGIDPQFHDRVFEIFQRLHTKDQYSGTGIGLAICKKIALRMGGRIWVESNPDGGSTFYFTLALARSDGDTRADISEDARRIPPTQRASYATN